MVRVFVGKWFEIFMRTWFEFSLSNQTSQYLVSIIYHWQLLKLLSITKVDSKYHNMFQCCEQLTNILINHMETE